MPSSPALTRPAFALIPAEDVTHSTRQVRAGRLVVVGRGVYAHADPWRAAPPWERYLARVHAHLLHDPDAVLALESAAIIRGMPIVGTPRNVHVLRPESGTSRRSGDVVVHTSAHRDRVIRESDGIRYTSPLDTAVDLARMRHPAIGLAAADAVLRADPTIEPAMLLAVNEARASSRGRRTARWALQRAHPAAESTFESISRAVVEWLGFPPPRLQHWIGAPETGGDRVDMWWPGAAVAGEADGEMKYDGRYGDPVAALRERNERDRRLRRNGARSIAHWTWNDVARPDDLRAILRSVGLSPVSPTDDAALFTLRRLLSQR